MPEQNIPEIKGSLRDFMLKVPEPIYRCSGIKILGRRIKSVLFSTDASIIRNTNADAVIAVYPFTPQPVITQAVMVAADVPVFVGVGGGLTQGHRVVNLALHAEFQGAIGVVVNAPTRNETIRDLHATIDVPIVITVLNEDEDIQGRIDSGVSILNVSAAGRTPQVVRSIRERFPDVPIIATGGPTDESILATVEAMQDGVLPADDEHLETLASETRRLSRLVDAMLKLSRLENGTTELKVERTDVVYLVKSLVSSQHQLFHEKGLHLRFINESGRDELMADIDADLIREAVVNLMSNAMRYTDEDGYVKVSARLERGDVLISVQDTGIGIAKEDIPQTFSRFWRSDVSRERVSGGLGVGLSLTKEIVDKHNGTILVESELGRGTTFTLRIPQNRGRRNLAQAIQEG